MPLWIRLSHEDWALVLGAVQALTLVVAAAFGLFEIHQLRRQRVADSLETMLREWRTSARDQEAVRRHLPLVDGPLELRITDLARNALAAGSNPHAEESREFREVLASARKVVHQLNDVGAYVERGSVDQVDFFGHFHVRILELVYLLEPYVLLVSATHGTRWGLRLRRLRTAAIRYHYSSRIHRGTAVRVRGAVIVPAKSRGAVPPWMRELRLRRRLITPKSKTYKEEDRVLAALRPALSETVESAGRTWPDLERLLP